MENTRNSIKQLFLRQFLPWIGLYFYVWYSQLSHGSALSQLIFAFFFCINMILVYYSLTNYVLPFYNSSILKMICLIVVLFALFDFNEYLYNVLQAKTFGIRSSKRNFSRYYFHLNSFFIFSFCLFIAFANFLNANAILLAKKAKEMELKHKVFELNHLKNQFISHLTFNFLNFSYSKILPYSVNTANTIENYAEILRYTMFSEKQLYISVFKEIENIKNIIELQKALNPKLSIEFSSNINNRELQITPLIFSLLLEQSISSAIFDASSPIVLNLESEQDNLNFKIQYLHKLNQEITSNDFDLVISILDKFHSNNYELKFENISQKTSIELKIVKNE